MIKFNSILFCLLANMAYSQVQNYAKAPNSYIYDLPLAKQHNYGGLEIPVAKAYAMWSQYEYLKTNGNPTPIPPGLQSASLYWEDVPGLVTGVNVISSAEAADAKIKVDISKGKGKGNAVIAFKVDGVIYWSWHIWVTDDPTKGVYYSHLTETDVNGNPIYIQYMDRNLGALSSSFLDNQWQKSGGLMYEWGRKDPFPPLVHKDADFYKIYGEVGVLRHKQIDPVNTIPVTVRPFDEIEKNIQYSVKNPLTYIINTDNTGNWFSSSRFRVPGASPNYMTWDLWSDNAKGGNSNGNSSNAALRNESRSYELKSELDPCPSGWRIPSYLGRETQNNNLSFFGRHDWNNDDIVPANRQLFPDTMSPVMHGVRVYAGLGIDFTDAATGGRNIGIMPTPGAYVYYPNSAAPNAPVGVTFQDNAANGGLWSATYGYDGGRLFSFISDQARNNTAVGLHALYNNITNPTKAGNAVRCMRDPNLQYIGDFPTQYFVAPRENFTEGLNNPNSYMVVGQQTLSIPVSKAFSVYNQILTEQEMRSSENLTARVIWSSNPQLLTGISLNVNNTDARLSTIDLAINPAEFGNAVVGLYYNTPDSPALWSWHIWAPEEDPNTNIVTYTTENPIYTPYNFVNATLSKSPALTTRFMDRNLGAISNNISTSAAGGLLYQWGRKDPLPSFAGNRTVYLASDFKNGGGTSGETARPVKYEQLSTQAYESELTEAYDVYGSVQPAEKDKIRENILYSIANPLTFLYQRNLGQVYDGGNHYANDLSKIRDWASDERGQGFNRWGHADVKSPFDPCPEGWRVPDVSHTNLYTGSKGNSPWYNGRFNDAYGRPGVIQDQWHTISLHYGGVYLPGNGWVFANSGYNVGDFPVDGIRGEIGENQFSTVRSGVWTASMADMNTGFALAMMFQGDKVQTGTGAYPQAAMSVRCMQDEKRLLPMQGARPKPRRQVIVLPAPESAMAAPKVNKDTRIYPNPFRDHLMVEGITGLYEFYDMSGKLVLKGEAQGRIETANLLEGVYMLKLSTTDGKVVTKKVLKQ